MSRIGLAVVLSLGVILTPLAVWAQTGKTHRIGFLGNSTAALEASLVGAFREGLRGLGYVEGQNVLIEYRWAEGKYDRFSALIGELLAMKVSVIATAGTPATLAVKKATTSVPLVMIAVGDPVGTGIVPSLSHPGGNITGLTSISTEMARSVSNCSGKLSPVSPISPCSGMPPAPSRYLPRSKFKLGPTCCECECYPSG